MKKNYKKIAAVILSAAVAVSGMVIKPVSADVEDKVTITLGDGSKHLMTSNIDGTYTYKIGKTVAGSAGTITTEMKPETKAGRDITFLMTGSSLSWLMNADKDCKSRGCDHIHNPVRSDRTDPDCATDAMLRYNALKQTFTGMTYANGYTMAVLYLADGSLELVTYNDSSYSSPASGSNPNGSGNKPVDIYSGPQAGASLSNNGNKYKVTKQGTTTSTLGEVAFTGTTKTGSKTITIGATVKIDGVSYKVTSIAKNAFKGNKNVTKVVIGSNVKTIGSKAFYGNKKLKTVIIKSKKIKKMGKASFKGTKKGITFKVPKSKKKAYKKMIKKTGAKKAKVK